MPTPSAEELQRIFKTLSDITRMRILRLLAQEELMVQELMEVLGMAQSRVSRHLAILREAGLVSDRRDGTYV
ncbi:MAG TPA: ArsR family transcriptional regulator, partial [Myxococcales bacterium]|nr:ArsR family transcriptional regulator [Myxococcales bacterium]